MTFYSPSKVFASVQTKSISLTGEQTSQNSKMISDRMYANNPYSQGSEKSDRIIKVTAVGEVSLPPDRCRVTVKIHSQKDNVQDVKNSVQRRLDYVVQTFQNQNIKEADIKIHKLMRRLEGMYDMVTEVIVVFLDFHKCQSACNLLVEKLDEAVTVGTPEFFHAGTTLETLRQQASLLSIHNAKQKAQEMAKFVHQAVGKPICIQEEENREWEGQIEGVSDIENRPTLQQSIAMATVTVSCRVAVTFELKPKVKTKNNKD
ncbi:IKBP1-like protein [Mya arenaria]|uniref:IKBP1-like protein n=1 Tax=Mya arenaria TaxID=6604 RepID=A0ABY7EGY9_MYAAR|nr:interleukin-1 receptor-associated kinase 1-binding protein 1-like [Mya arenaria]XP_052811456.1 interleukin-1 receptor-associated kinase 1-binding protein 1-like [Mya arenaria]WAR07815.1 IKBP1-like protein [Mya arenaria]WAR07928.1 IKBP1-like protein [Mya arenaria]